AARSSSLAAARTASSAFSLNAIALRALVICVLTSDLTLRLCKRRFCSWRIRFRAAALLGIYELFLPESSAPSHGLTYIESRQFVGRVPLDYSRNVFTLSNMLSTRSPVFPTQFGETTTVHHWDSY